MTGATSANGGHASAAYDPNNVVTFRPYGTLLSGSNNSNNNNSSGNMSGASNSSMPGGGNSSGGYTGGLHIDSTLANTTNHLLKMNGSHTPPANSTAQSTNHLLSGSNGAVNTLMNNYQPRSSGLSSTSSSSMQHQQQQQQHGDLSKENHEL
jgi:hypothetical protein